MSLRQIVCEGSGRITVMPTGKNPKVNCPRCDKRVGVMHSAKIRKHKRLAKV